LFCKIKVKKNLLLFRLSPAGLQRTLHSHFMLPRAIVPDPTTLVSLPVKSDQPNSPRIPAFLARSLSSSRNATVAAFDRAQMLSPHVRRSMPTVQSPSLLDLSSKPPCNQLHHAQLYRYASASRPHPICRCPPTSPRRASRPRRFHHRVTSSWCLGSSWPPMSRGAWGVTLVVAHGAVWLTELPPPLSSKVDLEPPPSSAIVEAPPMLPPLPSNPGAGVLLEVKFQSSSVPLF
jgi:hypothetical protein